MLTMSDLKYKPRAWILEPKVQRHPPRHIIRNVSVVEPTQEQRELADLDGDVYVPIYEIDHHRRLVNAASNMLAELDLYFLSHPQEGTQRKSFARAEEALRSACSAYPYCATLSR